MDDVLDERKKKILKAIIKTYMETGEPVGSRTISKYPDRYGIYRTASYICRKDSI